MSELCTCVTRTVESASRWLSYKLPVNTYILHDNTKERTNYYPSSSGFLTPKRSLVKQLYNYSFNALKRENRRAF